MKHLPKYENQVLYNDKEFLYTKVFIQWKSGNIIITLIMHNSMFDKKS